MRRLTAALLLSATALLTPAQAQRFTDVAQALDGAYGNRTAQGDHGSLRIQVTYQLQEAADRAAPLDAQKDALQAAHGRLYRVAGQECEAITQAFGGECRVLSLNVGNSGQSYGHNPLTVYTASAVFEVASPAPMPSKPH